MRRRLISFEHFVQRRKAVMKMYKNIGSTIKGLAIACGWIFLLGGAIIFALLLQDYYFSEIWFIPVIAIGGFLSSWPLYGFGELIDRVKSIEEYIRHEELRRKEE